MKKSAKQKVLLLLSALGLITACTSPAPTMQATRTARPTTRATRRINPTITPTATATGISTATSPPPSPTPMPTPTPQAGSDSIGDHKAPELGNTGYDVQRYTLALTIDPAAETISGTATIEAISTLPNLNRLSLDYSGPQITHLRVDGIEVDHRREGAKLYVNLARALAKGESFSITAAYSGHPQPVQSEYLDFIPLGMHFVNGAAFVASEPDGANSWFPCNDHPRDKALFRYEITVPQGYVVAANGQPEPPVEGENATTFIWQHRSPMATYLSTVAVGRYQVIEETAPNGIPLRHYVPAGSMPAARELLTRTGEMIVFLEQYFGPYPFASYGHIVVPMDGVSLETQSMTLIDAGVVARGLEYVVVHELAHQWFGDSVSPASWADIWLNEGFAVYASWLWDEAQSPERMIGQLEATERQAWQADSGEPLADPSAGNLFGFNSYIKGAWVLRMLRGEIGDEAFFDTLRAYHERFKGGVASSADFQAVAEEVSGQKLDWFFEQWVYGQLMPNLTVNWEQQSNGDLQVQVCQRQDNLFIFDLPLAVVGDDAQHGGETIKVDEIEEQFIMPAGFAVIQMQVDPNQALLAEVEVNQVEVFVPCR